MQDSTTPPHEKPAQSAGYPKTNWQNIVVPLVPIAVAIVVACLAGKYGGSNRTPAGATHGSALDIGAKAPDFTLEQAQGGTITLSQVTHNKPALLVFYQGYDCPRCVRHLRDLAGHQDELDKTGAQVFAISTDSAEISRESMKKFGDFPFPLLSDPGKKTARAYGLLLPDDTMLHGIFIVGTDNKIRYAIRSDRPYDNTQALLERLRQLQEKK